MKNILFIFVLFTLVSCNTSNNNKQEEDNTSKVEDLSKNLVGSDRDEHGCISSAGYVWSEVQQNCVRFFEVGVRAKGVNEDSSVFAVFSTDSLKCELFFSGDREKAILDRRTAKLGFVWNVEDDDTYNVSFVNGKLEVSQRMQLLYKGE